MWDARTKSNDTSELKQKDSLHSWSFVVTVSTLDSESSDGGSIPRRALSRGIGR